jgi:hypothetical protein
MCVPTWFAGALMLLFAAPVPAEERRPAAGATSAGGAWVFLGSGDITGASVFLEREVPILRHLSLVPRAGFLLAGRTTRGFGAGELRVNDVVVGRSPGITLHARAWSVVGDLDLLAALPIGNFRVAVAAGPSLRHLDHVRPISAWASWSPAEGDRSGVQYEVVQAFHAGLSVGLRADLRLARTLLGLRAAYASYTEGTPVLLMGASLGW